MIAVSVVATPDGPRTEVLSLLKSAWILASPVKSESIRDRAKAWALGIEHDRVRLEQMGIPGFVSWNPEHGLFKWEDLQQRYIAVQAASGETRG